jgi:two-component system, OmpR family, sensor histidine kinase TctE
VSAPPPRPRLRLPENASLREQLLVRLLVPVLLVTIVSSVISYYYAFNYATLAYDYELYDSALDIGRQAHSINGRVHLELPRAALDMLESDKHDNVYYMVNDAQGRFVTGHRGLPLPVSGDAAGKPLYYDGTYSGNPVRIAALSMPVAGLPQDQDHILILVAETLNKRRLLASEILLGMLLPELLLVGLIALLIWHAVARGLRPLVELQAEMANRSYRDLGPLPVHNAPGEVRALVGAMNDLLARLSTALSAQQRFIADAAHQLRTPLAGLRTQTELALREDDPEEVRRALHQIDTATARTTHLVNQLLSLARAEPGANRLYQPQALDLVELARETTAEWVPRAIARDIDLGFDGAAAAPIEGDAVLLREMLGNLLDNAIRYSPAGGQVTVNASIDDAAARLSVEDNGPGIPPDERERVFERFHRLLGNDADGCGLGLAIVREIAFGHGATVRLEAGAGGQGTRVTVEFPRRDGMTVANASRKSNAATAGGAP